MRETLALATPSGFEELPDPDTYLLKTRQDSEKLTEKLPSIVHIMPIIPNIIAENMNLPLETVLTELLYATSTGMMDMVWSPECVRCGGIVCQKLLLEDLPSTGYCLGCFMQNDINGTDKIKVYFVLNNEVLYFPVGWYECVNGAPAHPTFISLGYAFPTTTRSGFSYMYGVDSELSQFKLAKGFYRVLCTYTGADCVIHVEKDATESDRPVRTRLLVSEMLRSHSDTMGKIFTIPPRKSQVRSHV